MGSFLDKIRSRLSHPADSKLQSPEARAKAEHEEGVWRFFLQTGLLMLDWYRENNLDVVNAGVDPVEHFRNFGWREGRWPNPFFDPTWYLKHNPDVAQSGLNPIVHYWLYGENEGRKPHPLFEPRWYRVTYESEIGNNSALAHYLRNRSRHRHSPNELFDIKFYLESHPDVVTAKVDPFIHFITTGYREGRNPNRSFNVQYYLQHHMAGDGRDPLTHYFEFGREAGYSTAPNPNSPIHAAEIRRFTSRSPEFEELNSKFAKDLPRRAKVLAYYLPQFHCFPENDLWWGKGFTEWTNVGRGTPRFVGHYQPRIPRDFGFYDLLDPKTLPIQVAAAKAAALYGFCFYYYNFNGKRLLQAPIENFLTRAEIDFPFCLMWANENWTRRWDGAESEVLMRQDYRAEDAESLIDDIARHFKDSRYIRVEGRPLLFLYRADVIPEPRKTLEQWRRLFSTRHNEEPFIFMAQAFGNNDPTVFGFDGAIEFPPHKVVVGANVINAECSVFDYSFSAQVYRYDEIVACSIAEPAPAFPLIKTVFPGWDNDARRQGHGLSVTDSSPTKFAAWLDSAIHFASTHPFRNERFVFINAWNEWAEGAYLEPDIHFGGAYLNAAARAITGVGLEAPHSKLLLVGHNAFPAGAQLLLLNIAHTLKEQFGFEISFLLCGDGKLVEEYQELGAVTLALDSQSLESATRQLSKVGFAGVIANSVGSGLAVGQLKAAGAKVIALVHEMPKLMSANYLEAHAKTVASMADEVVFPSPIVRDAFLEFIGPVSGKTSIGPQGIYHRLTRVPNARETLISELNLPTDARIVLNVGYGDMRKGIDLFCAAARLTADEDPSTYYVWAGDVHPHLRDWVDDDLANRNVRFLGHRSDIASLMSAADVFILTSREDPFPSVVLEALSLGLPVLAFAGAGGYSDILATSRLGQLVPYCDTSALAKAVLHWLALDRQSLDADAQIVIANIATTYAFDHYAFDLVQRVMPTLKRISVIVPNFNYARYLPERLKSIFDQKCPIFEIIVLDDNSSDGSLEVIEQIATATGRRVHVVRNEENSGNPFAQWKRGLSLARGDLVWIAEADDMSDSAFLGKLSSSFLDPEVTFAIADSATIDRNGQPLALNYKTYYSRIFPGALSADLVLDAREFAKQYLSQRNAVLNVSAVLWRRDVLRAAFERTAHALPTFRLAGDWLLYLAACLVGGKIAYFSSELNSHRRHERGVTSRTAGERQIDEVARIHHYYNEQFGADEPTMDLQRSYQLELRAQFEMGDAPQNV